MKLTKEQLERTFALYQGFGVTLGQETPEITPVDGESRLKTVAVRLRGHAIHVNHIGQVVARPARGRRGGHHRPRGLTALERQLLGHALLGWSSGQAARRLGVGRRRADNALQRARGKVEDWQERYAPEAGTVAARRS